MRTRNTAVVGSIPPCVTFKIPLVRKATGNRLMNSTSLEKTQGPVSGFCSARNRVRNATQRSIVRERMAKEFVPLLAAVTHREKQYER